MMLLSIIFLCFDFVIIRVNYKVELVDYVIINYILVFWFSYYMCEL
jgi:hypothetical protein